MRFFDNKKPPTKKVEGSTVQKMDLFSNQAIDLFGYLIKTFENKKPPI